MYSICIDSIGLYADNKNSNAKTVKLQIINQKNTEHNEANPIPFKTGCQEKCGHLFWKMDYQSYYSEGHPVVLAHS
jgi:hypothetical protein